MGHAGCQSRAPGARSPPLEAAGPCAGPEHVPSALAALRERYRQAGEEPGHEHKREQAPSPTAEGAKCGLAACVAQRPGQQQKPPSAFSADAGARRLQLYVDADADANASGAAADGGWGGEQVNGDGDAGGRGAAGGGGGGRFLRSLWRRRERRPAQERIPEEREAFVASGPSKGSGGSSGASRAASRGASKARLSASPPPPAARQQLAGSGGSRRLGRAPSGRAPSFGAPGAAAGEHDPLSQPEVLGVINLKMDGKKVGVWLSGFVCVLRACVCVEL